MKVWGSFSIQSTWLFYPHCIFMPATKILSMPSATAISILFTFNSTAIFLMNNHEKLKHLRSHSKHHRDKNLWHLIRAYKKAKKPLLIPSPTYAIVRPFIHALRPTTKTKWRLVMASVYRAIITIGKMKNHQQFEQHTRGNLILQSTKHAPPPLVVGFATIPSF